MMFKEALTYDDIQIIPKYSEVEKRGNCDISTRFTKNFKISVPFVSAPMDTVTGLNMVVGMMNLGGVGCIHRFMGDDEQASVVKELKKLSNDDVPICVSIGVIDYKDRLEKVIKNGANVILIDVAHGNTRMVKNTIKYIKDNYSVDIIAGNVATSEGAKNLCEWGVDGVRVGIGNGCFTPDMEVKTDKGLKKISEIKVGNYVYTHTGHVKKVLDVFKYNRDEEIMIIDGIKCTKNHEFYVVDKKYENIINDNNIEQYAKWVSADELNKETHFLIEL